VIVACQALAALEDFQSVNEIEKLAKSPSASVQAAAIRALEDLQRGSTKE
jgi:hypothetical protein